MSQHAVLFRSVLPCSVCFLFCSKNFDSFFFGGGGGGARSRDGKKIGREYGTANLNILNQSESSSINYRALLFNWRAL